MTKFEDELDEMFEKRLIEIRHAISVIDNSKIVKAAEQLLEKKRRLQMAERALLGAGSKTTSSGGTGVTRQQVIAAFPAPGALMSVAELADHIGTNEAVVRGHLNRGNGESFVKHSSGKWGRRDPEAGFDTPEDFEEDDE